MDIQEAKEISVERIIGKYSSGNPGNLLLVTAGVHGNEASGVIALRNVMQGLEREKPEVKGVFLALAGNVQALNQNRRFIDEDLNRVWPDKKLKRAKGSNAEELEMLDIIKVLKDYPQEDFVNRFFIDCHSTSSESLPYISVQETGKNDSWAHSFPLYIVRGFSDLIEGSIDHYLSQNQFTGFAYEGGQHFADTTVEHQEAIIWLGLEKAGLLALDQLEGMPESVKKIREEEERTTFEIIHRHHLDKGDDFKMEPGYANFQKISKGEKLATHNGKEVISEYDARIFMPLYQAQGNDGFFVVEEVC